MTSFGTVGLSTLCQANHNLSSLEIKYKLYQAMRIPHHLRSEMSFNLKPLTHGMCGILGGWVGGGLFGIAYRLEYCVSIYQ